ncbi:ATP-binding protein [Polaromonas sp. P5_D5]
MNIFIAGIHGVGKTYLASLFAPGSALLHTSASKLIKEERTMANWGVDKLVSDVEGNQLALISAVRRHNADGQKLLLDGHFVLLDGAGQMVPLEIPVFEALNLSGVVLIEADAQVVVDRVKARDTKVQSLDHVMKFMALEKAQAGKICASLQIPLSVLVAPSIDEFSTVVSRFSAPKV